MPSRARRKMLRFLSVAVRGADQPEQDLRFENQLLVFRGGSRCAAGSLPSSLHAKDRRWEALRRQHDAPGSWRLVGQDPEAGSQRTSCALGERFRGPAFRS